ncbi:MAG: hypothetical protein V2A73_21670 [Pseudomonadota bacterium]
MLRSVALLCSIAAIAVTGCWDVTFGISASGDSKISVVLGELGGECTGEHTTNQGGATAEVARDNDGSVCNIIATFNADLIKADALREKIRAEISEQGYDPDDVDLSMDGLTLVLKDFDLVGLDAGDLPTVREWTTELSLNSEALADLKGESLASFLESQVDVSLSAEQVALFNAAYEGTLPDADKEKVKVKGKLKIKGIPLAELADKIPAGTVITLEFLADYEIDANATVDAF